MNDKLSRLPNTDTGLVTTIESVVLLLDTNKLSIYNLLTNRSSISSSLPRFKRYKETSSEESFKCEDGLESDVKKLTNIWKKNYNDASLDITVLKKGINI